VSRISNPPTHKGAISRRAEGAEPVDVINPAAVVAVKTLIPPKSRGWFHGFFTLSAT